MRVCGCVYFREYTRLLPVGEYVCGYVEMFLYMHTACLGVFIQTCMCVYIYIYTQRWSVCVYIGIFACILAYMHTAVVYVDTHGVRLCVYRHACVCV